MTPARQAERGLVWTGCLSGVLLETTRTGQVHRSQRPSLPSTMGVPVTRAEWIGRVAYWIDYWPTERIGRIGRLVFRTCV
eukprot:8870631-Pyramimonas_sp.AAC.1